MLFIGGGFSALLTSARLREVGVESIRIVERGSESAARGTGIATPAPRAMCRLRLSAAARRDGLRAGGYYAKGPEIFAHCQAIARRYDLYELAVFQTTVTSTVWDESEQMWHRAPIAVTQCGAFVICANGTLSKPKLSKIEGWRVQGLLLPHRAMGLRIHRRRPVRAEGQGGRHHRDRRVGGAGDPAPRRRRQGALRLPAHAVGGRHPG